MSLVAEMASAVTGSSDHGRNGESMIEIGVNGAGSVVVPDHVFLLTAGFDRHGSDLHLTEGAKSIVLKGYFAHGGTPVDLMTTTGATVTGQTAKILAGSPAFVQLAQAAGGSAGPAAIGKVTALTGDVQVIRAGVALASTGPEKVGVDTPVYRNDVLVTGKDSSVGVTFVDKTNFSLGADGPHGVERVRLQPAERHRPGAAQRAAGLVLLRQRPGRQTGPDAIKVQLPTMTIGIRGTTVAGFASAEGSESQVTLLKNSDGTVGAIFVNNSADGFLLNQANFTLYSSSFGQPMQQPALLVNLTKYQDALTTLQKTIQSSGPGKDAALSPADKALAEIQTAAGGENQSGSGSGGLSIQTFGSITVVTFQTGGEMFAALFKTTDFNRADGGPGPTSTATLPQISNEVPPTPPSDPVVIQVNEDMSEGGQLPAPVGSAPENLTFTLIIPPNLGVVALQPDGSYVYTPGQALQGLAQGQVTQDSFTIQIAGGPNGTVTQVITVDVTGVNDAPVAADDQAVTVQAAATGNVLSNDVDVDSNHVLHVEAVNGVAGNVGQAISGPFGSVTLNADGSYTFTPNQNALALREGDTGTQSVTYTVVDEFGATSQATLTIVIDGANDGPVVSSTSVSSVIEDVAPSVTGNLLAAASDADHDTVLAVASVNGLPLTSGSEGSGGTLHVDGTYGTLTVNANGVYSYALASAPRSSTRLPRARAMTRSSPTS